MGFTMTSRDSLKLSKRYLKKGFSLVQLAKILGA